MEEVKIHYLKIWPEYFEPLRIKQKSFDVRKNDRDFKKGDMVVFEEWDPATKAYTGQSCIRFIKYMIQGIFGLPKEICVLGIE